MANTITNKLSQIIAESGSPIDSTYHFVHVLTKEQPERAGYILAQAALAESRPGGRGFSMRGLFARVALRALEEPELNPPLTPELHDMVESLKDHCGISPDTKFHAWKEREAEGRLAASPIASLVLSMVVDHGFRSADG